MSTSQMNQKLQGVDIASKSWFVIFMQTLLFALVLVISFPMSHGDNVTDLASLISMKSQITKDPHGLLSSWNDSTHFCRWPGVTCGRRHQLRVTGLDLEGFLLEGRLSSYVGNLSFLRNLTLRNNSFFGEIPQAIGRLFRLQVMDFENNTFSGSLPVNISRCSNLRYLGLHRNNISGRLPESLGTLSKLENFDFFTNNLVGEIPASLGNLTSLRWFSVAENKLHGSIPSSFGKLTKLTHLGFTSNHLRGIIPPSIYNLSSIRVFSVLQNQIEGTLPPDLFHTLPNLEYFLSSTNQFSGSIPATISNASNLISFEVEGNKFTGKVPSFTIGPPNLRFFAVGLNDLGDGGDDNLNFLSSLVNCTNLEGIGIAENNFGGVLPESLSNFSIKLNELVFGGNQIRGSIPAEIGNLVNMQEIGFENNQLTGHIPTSVCKLKNLHVLYLSFNKLSGTIPSFIGNLTSLIRLSLKENNFEGSIPSSLAECKNFLELILSHNKLSGSIPENLLSSLSSSVVLFDLTGNHLTGVIPNEVGGLVSLVKLDISENRLSGQIPETIGSCTSLSFLYLEGNSLQGTIPHSLKSLRGIEEFDVSRNNLSGQIPMYLEDFLFLLYLNLSHNDFAGVLPVHGVFKNASAFSVMGNTKLCGGIPQLKLPRCVFDHHKKQNVRSLRSKIIISAACGLIVLLLLLALLYWLRKGSRSKATLGTSFFGVSLLKISYGDLFKATNGFSSENLIGSGSFGSVYKGVLHKEGARVVAVKVLKLQTSRASKSFIAECKALKNLKHRNLVKLITVCSSIDFQGNEFKALVYELMVNRSLEDWLHPSEQNVNLDHERHMHLNLIQRVNIAIDVASALAYLHNQCTIPIVHCDLKPNNILLDSDMTARVADFGLSRFLPNASHALSLNETTSIGIRGSIGYAAPEYGMGSEVSTLGDVYSYGILLLEMFTGKRPTNVMFNDGFSLHKFASMSLPDRIEEILDPTILFQRDERSSSNIVNYQAQNQRVQECLILIVRIGVACSLEEPRGRMKINDVVTELNHIKDKLLKTRTPRRRIIQI